MGRKVTHGIVGPDGRTELFRLADMTMQPGETVQAFVERSEWRIHALPTICVINDQPVMRAEWQTRRLSRRDTVQFLARPGMGGGGGGGGSSAKSIGAIVAMVALTVLAPWAGGAIAGGLGLAGSTLGGVAYSSIFSGIILAGGSLLISHFLKPKTGGKSSQDEELYSIAASGNQARPQQIIPVGYGRRITYPDFAAPPYAEFIGTDQYLYQLFAIGCGRYQLEQILIDDTILWRRNIGVDPSFASVQIEIVNPGDPVDLFPVNVVTASEVSGNSFASPSKDPINQGWIGGFVVNPSGTVAREIWLDFVWPSGMSATYKDRTVPANVTIMVEARLVDEAGVAIGGYNTLLVKTYTFNKDTQIRVTEKIPVPPGRYQVRARRTTDSITGEELFNGKVRGHDDVTWAALRAKIDGPQRFPGVTCLAIRARADQTLSGMSSRKIATIQTRIIPVWSGSAWVNQPTRNPVWAALDIWRNTDYGPGLSIDRVDFQTFYTYAQFYDDLEHTFDHFFTDRTSIQDAIETVLRVGRAYPSFIGDRMTMVRDEPRPVPRMLFTDREIVRGSLTINRRLLDEEWADGVELEYLDERNWKAADVTSAPTGTRLSRPSRLQIPGVVKRGQAVQLARYHALVNDRRRRELNFQVELEGRMLKRGDMIAVQSELPQTWGQGGSILSYDAASRMMTLDFVPTFSDAALYHYAEIRRPNGRPFGPVKVTATATPNVIRFDLSDLAIVEGQQGSATTALDREADEDPLSLVFSPGSPRTVKALVTRGRMNGMLTTLEAVVDDAGVYEVDTAVPPPPDPLPNFESAYPLMRQLAAQAYQRGATIVLRASWAPAKNALRYVIDISLDHQESWLNIYKGDETTCEAIIGGASHIHVRGAVVPPSGIRGTYTVVEVDAPPLVMSNEFFIMKIEPDDLRTQIRRGLEFQPLLQPIALTAAASRVEAKVASDKGTAAIARAEEVRADMEESFAAFQTTVTAQFEENQAVVDQLVQTRTTVEQAEAIAQNVVTAEIGDTGGVTVVQAIAASASAINNKLVGQYTVSITAGNAFGGFELIAENSSGPVISEFRLDVSKFLIGTSASGVYTPVFAVGTRNGVARVTMIGDFIADGSVNANQINVLNLSAISANIGTVTAGTIRSANGKMVINLTANTITISD